MNHSKLIVGALAALLVLAPLTSAQRSRSGDDAAAEAPTEKELRTAFKKAYSDRDPSVRVRAVVDYGYGTRRLPDDGAAEKIVARTLAGALDDDAPEVQAAAIDQLSWGRDVNTFLDAMEDVLSDVRNLAEKTSTRSGEDDRQVFFSATNIYGAACAAVGRHPDDRSVKMLAAEMRQVEPGAGSGQLRARLLRPLADALLALGSHDAVETVIKKTNDFSGGVLAENDQGVTFGAAARALHDALTAEAVRREHRGPEFSERYDVFWRHWFEEIEDDLVDELGRLSRPTDPPAMEPDEPEPPRRR